jgi:hypothetical protein
MVEALAVVALSQAILSSVSLNLDDYMAQGRELEYFLRFWASLQFYQKEGDVRCLGTSLGLSTLGCKLLDVLYVETQFHKPVGSILCRRVNGEMPYNCFYRLFPLRV